MSSYEQCFETIIAPILERRGCIASCRAGCATSVTQFTLSIAPASVGNFTVLLCVVLVFPLLDSQKTFGRFLEIMVCVRFALDRTQNHHNSGWSKNVRKSLVKALSYSEDTRHLVNHQVLGELWNSSTCESELFACISDYPPFVFLFYFLWAHVRQALQGLMTRSKALFSDHFRHSTYMREKRLLKVNTESSGVSGIAFVGTRSERRSAKHMRNNRGDWLHEKAG